MMNIVFVCSCTCVGQWRCCAVTFRCGASAWDSVSLSCVRVTRDCSISIRRALDHCADIIDVVIKFDVVF